MFKCGFVRSNFCLAMWVRSSLFPGLALRLGTSHDLVRKALGDFVVAVELHGVGGTPLRHRAHRGGVPEHLGERNAGGDDLGVASRLHALDAAAPRVEI